MTDIKKAHIMKIIGKDTCKTTEIKRLAENIASTEDTNVNPIKDSSKKETFRSSTELRVYSTFIAQVPPHIPVPRWLAGGGSQLIRDDICFIVSDGPENAEILFWQLLNF